MTDTLMEQKMWRRTFFNVNFIEIFKQVLASKCPVVFSSNRSILPLWTKQKNIFWGQKTLRSIFHMSKFIKYFNKF